MTTKKIAPGASQGQDKNVSDNKEPNNNLSASESQTKENPMDKLHSTFGFTTPIPDIVIEALPEIGAEGLAMFSYFMLRIYNDKRTRGEFACWPSYENIQLQTGFSSHMINKTIKVLVKKGWITKRRRFGDSTIYTLTMPGYSPQQDDELIEGHTGSPQQNVGSVLNRTTDQSSTERQLTKTNLTKTNLNQEQLIIIITGKLEKFGLTLKQAKDHLNKYGEEKCNAMLEYCKSKEYDAGAFVDGFKDNWEIPELELDPDSAAARQKYLRGWFD